MTAEEFDADHPGSYGRDCLDEGRAERRARAAPLATELEDTREQRAGRHAGGLR